MHGLARRAFVQGAHAGARRVIHVARLDVAVEVARGELPWEPAPDAEPGTRVAFTRAGDCPGHAPLGLTVVTRSRVVGPKGRGLGAHPGAHVSARPSPGRENAGRAEARGRAAAERAATVGDAALDVTCARRALDAAVRDGIGVREARRRLRAAEHKAGQARL